MCVLPLKRIRWSPSCRLRATHVLGQKHIRAIKPKQVEPKHNVAKTIKNSHLSSWKFSKAVTNYHLRNSRAQNSLLFPCQCHESSLNHWSMVWTGLLPRMFSYYQLLHFYVLQLINDSNCFYGIGKGKAMNPSHGPYGQIVCQCFTI